MSAAVGNVLEAAGETMSVREWLSGVASGAVPESSDATALPPLAAVCGSAVAPLEIAAALEAAGMSQREVQETTHHADVFALADELWKVVPFVEADVQPPRCWRRGNIADIGRGALYAAPALIIHGFAKATDFRFRWWTLPLAMTIGWAMGQLTAFGGYTLRARNDGRGEARLATLLLIVAAALACGCAWAARRTFGGDIETLTCVTAVTVYMVASSILLMHEEERLGALLLAPAAMASVAVVTADVELTRAIAVGAIAVSGVGTLIAASRHFGWPIIRRASFTAHDAGLAVLHFVHGLMCGTALSVILLIGTRVTAFSTTAAATSAPLLATLGLMEWRLRTFRADVEKLGRDLEAIDAFACQASRIFIRGFATYLAGVLVIAAGIAVALHATNTAIPVPLLVAEVALGALYYVDLTLTSIGRLDVVMRAWTIAILVTGMLLAIGVGLGDEPLRAGWWSAHVAVWVALIALLLASSRIIAAPCSH